MTVFAKTRVFYALDSAAQGIEAELLDAFYEWLDDPHHDESLLESFWLGIY